jgi:hypothetical protein
MPVGKIGEFDSTLESFENYIDRLGHYFAANDVADAKKKPVFLAACGPKVYEVLKNLCLPEDPSNFTYRECVKKLKDHFKPAPLLIYERYKFSTCHRKPEEKISDFAVKLKSTSSLCEFGDFLDSALCMQFVTGLNMSKAQDKLLQERTLTFNKAVGMAQAVEMAAVTCAQLDKAGSQVANHSNVNKVEHKKMTASNQTCWRCGKTDHGAFNCFFKSKKCHKCKQYGHVQARCEEVKKFYSQQKPAHKPSEPRKKMQPKKKSVKSVGVTETHDSDDEGLPLYGVYDLNGLNDVHEDNIFANVCDDYANANDCFADVCVDVDNANVCVDYSNVQFDVNWDDINWDDVKCDDVVCDDVKMSNVMMSNVMMSNVMMSSVMMSSVM